MNRALPDVSLEEMSSIPFALQWVGMRGMRMPVRFDDLLMPHPVPACIDVLVDLPDPRVKGIHMSRLYALVNNAVAQPLQLRHLAGLLDAAIASHEDCGSTAAQVRIACDLVRMTPALVTADLSGWTGHALVVEARRDVHGERVFVELELTYSSTCPCSASLARRLLEEHFLREFAGRDGLDAAQVAEWLRQHASHATPHSQRSVARLTLEHALQQPLDLGTSIRRAEEALGTPAQSAVKRADEQAFARRNGQNLMFVEDAARRLLAAFTPWHRSGRIDVTHLESLHPHDAVASASWGQQK